MSSVVKAFDFLVEHRTSRWIEAQYSCRYFQRTTLVEDNPADVELVLVTLRKDGFDVSSEVVQTAEEFTLRIQASGFDVILADYKLPQWRGMEALEG